MSPKEILLLCNASTVSATFSTKYGFNIVTISDMFSTKYGLSCVTISAMFLTEDVTASAIPLVKCAMVQSP